MSMECCHLSEEAGQVASVDADNTSDAIYLYQAPLLYEAVNDTAQAAFNYPKRTAVLH